MALYAQSHRHVVGRERLKQRTHRDKEGEEVETSRVTFETKKRAQRRA